MIKDLQERFDEKYEVVTESGCWIWIAYTDKDGYGTFWKNGMSKRAHRVSYELYKTKVPEDMLVCHRCDTPSCVNPDHLFLGTISDNMKDRSIKGRNRNQEGENHNMCKLSEKEILEIRDLLENSPYTQRTIADDYGISYPHLSDIKLGKRWSHL